MTLIHWLRSALAPRPTSRSRLAARRLRVEPLEDRLTPSTGGLLDPTFGSGGYVLSSLTNRWDVATGVAVQPDGKLVVADGSLVARYNANGTLDTSFGSGGDTATGLGFVEGRSAVAFQPQAGGTTAIVVFGVTTNPKGTRNFALTRLTTNGKLDTTFGKRGTVVTDMGGSLTFAGGMVVDAAGRIIVSGYGGDAVLARYSANGALDTTFGSGGKLLTTLSLRGAPQVALQADGKIVLAAPLFDPTLGETEFVTGRFNANGTADATFGTGGAVATHVGASDTGGVVALDGAGRILVAGWDGVANQLHGYYLLRYAANGALDTTFGSGGVATLVNPAGWSVVAGTMVAGVAVQANGQIVVGGNLADGQGEEHEMAVRVNPGGTLDTSYGSGGWASTVVGFTGEALVMALQPDGSLVLAGDALPTPTTSQSPRDLILIRFLQSAPQVASFTASPNPVTAGSLVTLTASSITDGNPNSTVTQVTFYYIDGTGTKQVLGYGTSDGLGDWALSFTVNLAPGTYTLYAQAQDSYGVFGDPFALTFQVN
jgi:uncharacterized delta-60 repeat protein